MHFVLSSDVVIDDRLVFLLVVCRFVTLVLLGLLGRSAAVYLLLGVVTLLRLEVDLFVFVIESVVFYYFADDLSNIVLIGEFF